MSDYIWTAPTQTGKTDNNTTRLILAFRTDDIPIYLRIYQVVIYTPYRYKIELTVAYQIIVLLIELDTFDRVRTGTKLFLRASADIFFQQVNLIEVNLAAEEINGSLSR